MRNGSVWPHRLRPNWIQPWAAAHGTLSWIRQSYRGMVGHQHGTTAVEPSWLDPEQCALLVVDCLPEVTDSLPHSEALVFQINQAIDVARRRSCSICFVRTAFDDLDYRFTPSTNKEFSASAQRREFQNGSVAADVHRGLSVQPDDLIIRKTRLGAFSTTDLDEQLTNMGITTLIIAGAHTSGAVLSTVREAADRDYRVVVLSDCISDIDKYAHALLIDRIMPRQAEIVTVRRLDGWLIGARTRPAKPMHQHRPADHTTQCIPN